MVDFLRKLFDLNTSSNKNGKLIKRIEKVIVESNIFYNPNMLGFKYNVTYIIGSGDFSSEVLAVEKRYDGCRLILCKQVEEFSPSTGLEYVDFKPKKKMVILDSNPLYSQLEEKVSMMSEGGYKLVLKRKIEQYTHSLNEIEEKIGFAMMERKKLADATIEWNLAHGIDNSLPNRTLDNKDESIKELIREKEKIETVLSKLQGGK